VFKGKKLLIHPLFIAIFMAGCQLITAIDSRIVAKPVNNGQVKNTGKMFNTV